MGLVCYVSCGVGIFSCTAFVVSTAEFTGDYAHLVPRGFPDERSFFAVEKVKKEVKNRSAKANPPKKMTGEIKMKKVIILALAALMLLSLAVPAMADESDFNIQDGVLLWYQGPGGDVVVPDGVTEIEMVAFSAINGDGCAKLTSVTIPSGVTKIGGSAFAECTNLKSVIIPASVTIISYNPFTGCTSLTDVYFGGTQEQWKAFEQFQIDNDYGSGMFDTGAHVTVHFNSTGPDAPTTPEQPTTPTTPTTSFGDVSASAWYAAPVAWAVEKGITGGTGGNKFSPNKTCNTAEILTFLWRACGTPKADAANFSDVAANAWYADAANWAKSKGMVSGSALSPNESCTRASAVMFIWQAMGKPAASKAASFADVDANADYAAAVSWALEKGVTNGTGADKFSPDGICTRAEIVTFLQRAYA